MSKTTVIPHCQFPKASLKGDDNAIKIPENEYKSNLESCKNHLLGRLILSKGDPPLKLQELRDKLNIVWKPLSKWGLVSLGRDFYEFVFSDVENVQRVRAVLSWSLKPGFLKLFAWTPDFNSNNHKQTTVQCWVRFLELPQEYWSHNIIFAIASCLGTPLRLDAETSKFPLEISFGHFARVLVDIDLSANIRHNLWVEREGYVFLVNVVYENLPLFRSQCHNIGHSFSSCKLVNVDKEKVATNEKHKRTGHKPMPVPKYDLGKESVECVTNNATKAVVDNNPLLGFVDGTNVVDIMHPEDMVAQANENLSDITDTEPLYGQGNIDMNCDSADIFCQDDHQEEAISNTIPLGGNSIVVTNSDLSNFSASVIHDMQVIGIFPTEAQQSMNFLSKSWANMARDDEIVDLDDNTS